MNAAPRAHRVMPAVLAPKVSKGHKESKGPGAKKARPDPKGPPELLPRCRSALSPPAATHRSLPTRPSPAYP